MSPLAHQTYRPRRVLVAFYADREVQRAIRKRYHDGAKGYATHDEVREFVHEALRRGAQAMLDEEDAKAMIHSYHVRRA